MPPSRRTDRGPLPHGSPRLACSWEWTCFESSLELLRVARIRSGRAPPAAARRSRQVKKSGTLQLLPQVMVDDRLNVTPPAIGGRGCVRHSTIDELAPDRKHLRIQQGGDARGQTSGRGMYPYVPNRSLVLAPLASHLARSLRFRGAMGERLCCSLRRWRSSHGRINRNRSDTASVSLRGGLSVPTDLQRILQP
jgi:hypothetical protein